MRHEFPTSRERTAAATAAGRVGEVASVALRLGVTAFGGPAVHIAMLREEVVTRRRWMSDEEFFDLLGATNLIPGPNSTEMVIHAGLRRAGWSGFALAGSLFILPAALIVLAFAWAYTTFGSLPAAEWILYGIKPVIIAVVLQAIWGLGRTMLRKRELLFIAVAGLAAFLTGTAELAVLFGCAMAGLLIHGVRRGAAASFALAPLALSLPVAAAAAPAKLIELGLVFLKIGAVLYGSGYVLIAFLRGEFVERLGWLTDRQLLDAVAVGQVTPGPVFTTATFVGYLIGSWQGAAIATVAIFLPAFLFVALTSSLIPRMRESRIAAALLDGVNAGALALMAGVTWQLGRAAIVDWLTASLAILSTIALVTWRINSAWLVLGGALVAMAFRLLA